MESVLVDRYREVFEIYHVYASSIQRESTPKPTVPVLPHYSGMGKTALSLLFPQVIQRPPEADKKERRRILAEVSQSRFWSSGYEKLAESAIADTSKNVVVALHTARWSHIKDIKNISWFATCKPLLVSGAGIPLNSALIMHKFISHLESHITKENAGKCFPVLQLVAAQRPLCVVLDEMLDGTATDIASVILTLLSYGVMVILCGVSTKVTVNKVIDRAILRYETVSLRPLRSPYLAEIMTTAALTLGRRFSRGFVDQFCDQLFLLFGGHARAATTVIAHALQTSTKERTLSLEDAIIRNAAKEVYSENDIEKHFAAVGARGPILMGKALPLIVYNAVLNTAVDGACRLPFDYSLTDILLGFPIPYTLSTKGTKQLIHFYPSAVSLPTLTRFAFERVQRDMLLSFDAASLTQTLKLSQETGFGTFFEDLLQWAMFLRLCLHRSSNPEYSSAQAEQIIPFTSALGLRRAVDSPAADCSRRGCASGKHSVKSSKPRSNYSRNPRTHSFRPCNPATND
jgi:hypothetical protein